MSTIVRIPWDRNRRNIEFYDDLYKRATNRFKHGQDFDVYASVFAIDFCFKDSKAALMFSLECNAKIISEDQANITN